VLMLRESEELAEIKVADIMTRNVKTVTEDTSVSAFLDIVARYHHITYPVVNKNGEPVGIATLEEASKIAQANRKDTPVSKIMRSKLVTAYPEETALDAFKKMEKHEVGRILIMDPENPKKMLGMVTKTDLMHIMTNNAQKTET
jgi:CIC family chloride channel protein